MKTILNELQNKFPSGLLDLVMSFDESFVDYIWSKFLFLIKNGDLKQMKQFQKRYHLTRNDKNLIVYLFGIACTENQLPIAQWIHSTFQITKKEAKQKIIDTFNFACATGLLLIAQWLYLTFQITQKEIKKQNNYAFRLACPIKCIIIF